MPITPYRDGFGNWGSRIVAPAGRVRLGADGLIRNSGLPDVIGPAATPHAVEDLPAEAIVYLLGSRYCETDRLSDLAWIASAQDERAEFRSANFTHVDDINITCLSNLPII